MTSPIEAILERAELAQQVWNLEIMRRRARKAATLAGVIADRYQEFVDAIQRPEASAAEKLSSEVLPLADACRYTSAIARRALAPRSYSGWYGAWWLGRVGVRMVREPWGTVLVLAPSNYPLFLPGVQAIQALVAGNAVVIKPAPGHAAVVELLKACLHDAGFPPDLLQILPTDIEAGLEVMRSGVDKVLLTGSLSTGRAVLRELSETMTPATMELSGCDAVFILPQANVEIAAKAISYALQLNGGRTCIAPRRIFVTPDNAVQFSQALQAELANAPRRIQLAAPVFTMAQRVVSEALSAGAQVLCGTPPADLEQPVGPLVLTQVQPEMKIARSDLFAPIACILTMDTVEDALAADRLCPYRLGASVFGPTNYAAYVAGQISAGCVVLNDLVAPTADPRVSFGGRDRSGWGLTRGAEGLLEMTRPKVICARHGKWLPHLDPSLSQDSESLALILQLFHGDSWNKRWQALVSIIQRGRRQAAKKVSTTQAGPIRRTPKKR